MAKQSKILIVEDDPNTAEMLSAYFEAQGNDVLTASWGNDAVALCQDVVPDLVIQDVRLPDIDGYEVVRKLRNSARTSNVPIIFLTNKKEREDKMAGLKLGAIDYITKPFDMQELRLRVRNALRRASHASLVNPVTGLPGREVAEARVKELVDESNWAVLYVSISDVVSFNEAYGFVAGDDVLRAVGLILSNVIDEAGTVDDFVGHVGQADFLLVTHEKKATNVRDKLSARLERAFDYFYPVKDLQSGSATDMKAEIGLVTASMGTFRSPADIIHAVTHSRQVVASSHAGA
jgi:PleD family two-component response regulator